MMTIVTREPKWAVWIAWLVTFAGITLAALILAGVLMGCRPLRSNDLPSVSAR